MYYVDITLGTEKSRGLEREIQMTALEMLKKLVKGAALGLAAIFITQTTDIELPKKQTTQTSMQAQQQAGISFGVPDAMAGGDIKVLELLSMPLNKAAGFEPRVADIAKGHELYHTLYRALPKQLNKVAGVHDRERLGDLYLTLFSRLANGEYDMAAYMIIPDYDPTKGQMYVHNMDPNTRFNKEDLGGDNPVYWVCFKLCARDTGTHSTLLTAYRRGIPGIIPPSSNRIISMCNDFSQIGSKAKYVRPIIEKYNDLFEN